MKKEPMVYRNIRMPKPLDDKARKAAKADNRSLSGWIRSLIISALAKTPVIIVCILLSACSTLPMKSYEVRNLDMKVVVIDESVMSKITFKRFGSVKAAFIEYGPPITIYVSYSGDLDKDGNRLPDFHSLGHEVWHLKPLGGLFHVAK